MDAQLQALFLQGMTHQQSGDYQAAKDCWLAILKQDPGQAAARGQLGVADFWLGDRETGLTHLRDAMRQAPSDAALPYLMAGLCLEQGEIEEAQHLFTKAAGLAGDNGALFGLIVDDLIRMDQGNTALTLCTAQPAGDDPALLAARAKAHLACGQTDIALALATQAYTLMPDAPFAMEVYGAALMVAGDEAALAPLLAQAEAMPAELCERLFLIWARILEMNGKLERAWDFLNALTVSGTDSISALMDQARLSLALNKNEQALPTLTKLKARAGEMAQTHLLWGQYHVQTADVAQAVPLLRRALDIQPTLMDAYALLNHCGALNTRDHETLGKLKEDETLPASARAQARTLLKTLP